MNSIQSISQHQFDHNMTILDRIQNILEFRNWEKFPQFIDEQVSALECIHDIVDASIQKYFSHFKFLKKLLTDRGMGE